MKEAAGFDVSGWWLVHTNGKDFVGKCHDRLTGGRRLTCLQGAIIQTTIVPGPGGMPRPKTDVLTIPWFTDTLDVPDGACWVSLEACDNRAAWGHIIAMTEKLKLEVRASKSHIHLASGH